MRTVQAVPARWAREPAYGLQHQPFEAVSPGTKSPVGEARAAHDATPVTYITLGGHVQTSRDQSSAVSRYITHVRQIPELSREEEAELARAFRDSADQRAAARLALANLRHVVSIAVSYRRYGIPLSELIAEGNFGIVHAIRKYDPERGNRFVTYAAYWIRAYILNHVIHSWSLVGVGSGPLRSKMFFRLRREGNPGCV